MRKILQHLAIALFLLQVGSAALGQVVGLQPTPQAIYTWNAGTNQWDKTTTSNTANPTATTPQAFAFYEWNPTLGQWVPCETAVACLGSGGGTTTRALTAAVTGGVAPGTTFNGSAAVTFDYHSFGAAGITGTPSTGNCVTWTSANTLGDAGSPCGSGSGGVTGSGTLGYVPLWTPNGTTLGNSHLDDGVTNSGIITSSEPFYSTSGTSTQPAFVATNNGTSSSYIAGIESICPNLTTGQSDGCGIYTGFGGSGNGIHASFVFLDKGSSSTNLGALGMANLSAQNWALQWDLAGDVFLPQLLSAPCLATDGSGKVFSGSCGGGSTTDPLTANTSGGAAPGTTFNGSAAVTFDYHSFGAAPTASPTFTGTVTLPVTGSTQCLHVNSSGAVSGTGSDCGSGGGSAPTGTGVPQVASGLWGTTVDMGTTANIPLVSNGSHSGQVATGTLNTGGSGTSVYNVTTTTIGNLGTLTGLTANTSVVMVTDGASCGDTSTGGGSVNETLRYLGSATWAAIACGPVGSVTANGLFSQMVFTPTTSGSGLTTNVNQSATFSATNNSTGITLYETTPQTGTNAAEAIEQVYPTSFPFTRTALLSFPFQPNKNTHFGIIITTTAISTSPAMEYFWGINSTSATSFNNLQINGVTNLTATGTGTIILTAQAFAFAPSYIWVRYSDDGTNIAFSYSEDGSNWVQIYSIAKASSYLGASGFGYIGVFLYNGGTVGSGATLLSWH